MARLLEPLILLLLLLFFHGLDYAQQPQFGDRVDLGIIEHEKINEASGIAASGKNSGVFWTHNDSGDKNRLFAFDGQGRHLGIYYINGIVPQDWEDMAIGPGPTDGQSYLYIGDIGDNQRIVEIKTITRVVEPDVSAGQDTLTTDVTGAETITFRYTDGNHDAEALMVDPLTKDLYVVTKDTTRGLVFRAAYPQSTGETITLELVATLPLGWIVSGDISPDGQEILVKTYSGVFYWHRKPGEPLWQAFNDPYFPLPYTPVLQEEAIAWKSDGMGYYTLSEEPFGLPCHLYFYPREETSPVEHRSGNPSKRSLYQNYPNPFNTTTNILYRLVEASHVHIEIYDNLGELVISLVNESKPAGLYSAPWYGEDRTGRPVSSGSYIVQLKAGTIHDTKRMLLLK